MTTSNDKFVVIHADDLGMSHGANVAFVELSRLGVFSSGSVMVPCPWFHEIVELARADPALDVGVHLTLTSEMSNYRWRPLTRPPASAGMTDDYGYFHRDVGILRARAAPDAVEAELRAQIDMALASGIDLTHFDDHAGAVLAPEFCDIYVRLGIDYNLPIVMTPSLATYGGIHNLVDVDDKSYRRRAAEAQAQGYRMFDRIIETLWQPAQPPAAVYKELIAGITSGYTFMALHVTQPGEIEAIDLGWHHIRTAEYHLFRSSDFREWLRCQDLEVIGMKTIRDAFRARTRSVR